MGKKLSSGMREARSLVRRAAGSFVLALALLSSSSAYAQGEEEEQDPAVLEARRTEAKMRYEEGAQAYKDKRYKDAVDLFLEADRILSSAPLSFNIARAYEKLGDNSGALQWYRDYLRREPQAKNSAEVERLIDALEQKLAEKGVQQMTVRTRPRGATVVIDEQPVGVTPWSGDVPPGKHRVTLRMKGFAETSRELELPVDEALDVEVRLVPAQEVEPTPVASKSRPAPVPEPTAPPAPRERGTDFGPWPYITLGAGGLALGGALTFEVLRRRSEDEARTEPTQLGHADKYDTMESHQTTARVLTAVGGALVITGGVLLVIEAASGGSSDETAAVGVGCDGRGCGLAAQGRF